MNVSIGERWEQFVDRAVKAGHYGSALTHKPTNLRFSTFFGPSPS